MDNAAKPETVIVPPPKPPSAVKEFFKWLVHSASTVLILPFFACYWLCARFLGPDRALEGASQTMSLFPGYSGAYLRRAFLSLVLTRCHRSVEISFGTLFSQAGAILDENVYIGPRCHLGLVHLKRDVLVAAGVHVPSGGQTHYSDDPTKPIRDQGGERRMITIGEGAWIGSAAIILADVGRGTIVGAGSVVTKPLPDNVIAAGVPARVIRSRFAQESGNLTGDSAS